MLVTDVHIIYHKLNVKSLTVKVKFKYIGYTTNCFIYLLLLFRIFKALEKDTLKNF